MAAGGAGDGKVSVGQTLLKSVSVSWIPGDLLTPHDDRQLIPGFVMKIQVFKKPAKS